MSQTFSIICEETKEMICIGQGWGEMTTFYSSESDVMEKLHEFLNKNMYKTLRVINDDCDEYYDYKTFKKESVEDLKEKDAFEEISEDVNSEELKKYKEFIYKIARK